MDLWRRVLTVLVVVVTLLSSQTVFAGQYSRTAFVVHSLARWRHCQHPYVPFGDGGAAEIVRIRRVSCARARRVVRAYMTHAYMPGRGRVRGFYCVFGGPPELGACRKGRRVIRFVSD
jgi:hypothetical protein